jgi:branched-chain amino acid transport system ATP-binding protein
MDDPLLKARGLHKRYGGLVATQRLDLDLYRGEIHALIGPNGAGKTTALAQLSGELRPDAGRIHLDGHDVTALAMPARARLGIARSFQITAVFEEFTVRENVALAVQARAPHHFRFWRSAAGDAALCGPAQAAITAAGLDDAADEVAGALAHGRRRQLEIAMALATQPRVLLLDEPMAGMAAEEVAALSELLQRLRADHAILLVEHDMDVVFRLADRVTVLVDGAVIASDRPDAIRADAAVQAAYLEGEAPCC